MTFSETWHNPEDITLNNWNNEILQKKIEIVEDFIKQMEKENPLMTEEVKKVLKDYLINDGSLEEVVNDIFRWILFHVISSDESMNKIIKLKETLSSTNEIQELEALRNVIIDVKNSSSQNETTITPISNTVSNTHQTTSNENLNTTSETTSQISNPIWNESLSQIEETSEYWKQFINTVFKKASQRIWTKYTRWWISPNTWFDCSGLWYWSFKETFKEKENLLRQQLTTQGLPENTIKERINSKRKKFSQRLTAHGFSKASTKIEAKDTQIWDLMFWDQKPWTKKHDSIYHIEMIISKPYTKDWKTYVRTLWSSTDTKDDRWNKVGNWVQVREREMKNYRHYWRPPFYNIEYA